MWGLGLRGQVKGSFMFRRYPLLIALSVGLALATSVGAQQTNADTLKIYFQTGSAGISSDGRGTLDQAARLFRDGNPIVMIVAGGADTVGKPDYNLRLSIRRAQAVADGLPVLLHVPPEQRDAFAGFCDGMGERVDPAELAGWCLARTTGES